MVEIQWVVSVTKKAVEEVCQKIKWDPVGILIFIVKKQWEDFARLQKRNQICIWKDESSCLKEGRLELTGRLIKHFLGGQYIPPAKGSWWSSNEIGKFFGKRLWSTYFWIYHRTVTFAATQHFACRVVEQL